MDNTNTSSGEQSGIAGRVRHRAAEQLNTQKGRATEGLDALAQAVRQSTERLRTDQHDVVAQYVDRAADQLQRLSTTLRDKDVNEIVRDVQDLARRRPALIIGGSFLAGVLAARFFKSSPPPAEYRSAEYPSAEYASTDTGARTPTAGDAYRREQR